MIDIYICEDIKEHRDNIAHCVEEALTFREYDMRLVISTDKPEVIIEQLKKTKNTGLYFLDIDLKSDKNGIELAKEIREYDPRGFIAFITSHSEMSYMTFQYKVEALDFILKNEWEKMRNQICECIDNVNNKYMKISRGSEKTITISRAGRKITLVYSDIMFFETSANEHKLVVHTANKTMEFFGKMKDIEDEVGDDFIRCHRAYLVNRKNIKEVIYDDKLIVMKNQAKCPISHRMLRLVKSKV